MVKRNRTYREEGGKRLDATKADLSRLATGSAILWFSNRLSARKQAASPRRASAAPRTNRINFITFVFRFPPHSFSLVCSPPHISLVPFDLVTFTTTFTRKKNNQ